MVDVLKSVGIDYIASCPGSTFRAIHELLITYGNNTKPEFLTTLHEDTSAAMCHGYAKIAKKPMACMADVDAVLEGDPRLLEQRHAAVDDPLLELEVRARRAGSGRPGPRRARRRPRGARRR